MMLSNNVNLPHKFNYYLVSASLWIGKRDPLYMSIYRASIQRTLIERANGSEDQRSHHIHMFPQGHLDSLDLNG